MILFPFVSNIGVSIIGGLEKRLEDQTGLAGTRWVLTRGNGTITRFEQRANGRFIRRAIVCSQQVADLSPVFRVKERSWNRAPPSRQHGLHKRVLAARFS